MSSLPTDVALYIASNIRSNVRELEGALIRLTAYVSLTGRDLSMLTAQEVLKNIIDSQVRKITIEAIQRAVSDQFGLRPGGDQGQEQLALDRLSAPDCHVPGQASDRGLAAGDRPPVRRQAPHHRAAFGGEDHRAPQDRQGFEQVAEQTHRSFGWVKPRLGRGFSLSGGSFPWPALWMNCELRGRVVGDLRQRSRFTTANGRSCTWFCVKRQRRFRP